MEMTDWVAVYAAALSTFIFVQERLRAKPKFRIILTFGCSDERGEPSIGVWISIQNTSTQVVQNFFKVHDYARSTRG